MLAAIFTAGRDDNQGLEVADDTSNSAPVTHPIRRKLSSIRRRLSQIGKSKSLDESLHNVPENNSCNDTTENKEEGTEELQNNTRDSLADKSVVDIQNEAKRVCAILSGEVKKHLRILRTLDPTNCLVDDIKKTMKEANVWLVECLSPPSLQHCEDECIKEAKLNHQFHAERCLLDANELAVREIKRLSDVACCNAKVDTMEQANS